jgi:hypothetical protein
LYLKTINDVNFNDTNIIIQITSFSPLDTTIFLNGTYNKIYKSLLLQKKIFILINKFLFINGQDFIHLPEKNIGIIDLDNKPLVFGSTIYLDNYGFKNIHNIFKINSVYNFGLSNTIRWFQTQNNALTLNFNKTERLFSGIFLINETTLDIHENFLERNIKNLKLLEIINITLPFRFKKNGVKKIIQINYKYFVFFDDTADEKKIIILNNRGHTIEPPELIEQILITYRELTIIYSYGCNFYKCKDEEFKFIYLVSSPEYSGAIPIILQKLGIYEEFATNFEPAFLIKDKETKALIFIDKKLDLLAYPPKYKDLYLQLKKISNPETIKNIPLHAQTCS